MTTGTGPVPAAAEISEQQRDVIAFLSSPGTYDPAPARVVRIDTHGAHVFLAERDVLKIKRAVRYPYMDFSTLEKRRRACARELEINAVHAPAIYKGLVSITRGADGRLSLGGAGVVIEWAVHMARFREEDVLVNRIARVPLSGAEAKALADAVVRSHAQAAVVTRPRERTAIGRIIADVLTALPSLFRQDQAAVAVLSERLAKGGETWRELLKRRALDGQVRRCHGDLHLGNIVLLDGQPTLFDAIEFDEDLATIDVLYDLAFLLMDLDHRGHRATANVVLNRYLWRRQVHSDLDALAALPVFLSLRAAIRAMVGAQRASVTGEETAAARAYLVCAAGYLDESPPQLVLIGGLSGSGKSTLAAAVAPSLGRVPGALHVRSDLERKALFGVGEFDRLPNEAYAAEATARVYERILRTAEAALRAGHSVVADAVHADPAERKAIETIAERTGARLSAFWLDAPQDVLMQRVGERKNDASDATPQVVERQMTYNLGKVEWTRIDASGPPEETLRTALSHLHASIGSQ